MIAQLKLFVFIFLLCACNSRQPATVENVASNTTDTIVNAPPIKDSFTRGIIITHVVSKNDQSQSYALYIPAAKRDTIMPVIYCFDPHGDGSLPLKNYQSLADVYHFILVGSNNAKNGIDMNTIQAIWNTLYNDTQNRLPQNKLRLYTCGFSGGAKVAGFIALHQNDIKGVIAAGAPLPEDASITNLPFTFTGMAGRGDMNMTDLMALNNELDKTTASHRLILFDGKHAWPPVSVMRTAFAGLELDAMRSKLINKNDSLIKVVATEMNSQIAKQIAARQLIEATQTCVLAINLLNGLTDATTFDTKEKTIQHSPLFQQQLQASQELFAKEQQQKQVFQQQFQQADIQYWTATINSLMAKANASTAEGAMYQRLLAYLSLAFYSISNQLLQNNQNDVAQHFITLYKMVDATNPEAWYFSALLNARSSNARATENDLVKAAENGFADTARMLQQPEFQTLGAQINFQLIESRMKKTD